MKAWCDLMVREAGGPIAEADLPVRCGVRPAELVPLLEELTAQGRVLRLGGAQLVHLKAVEDKAAVLLAGLKDFHARQPQRAGMPRGDWYAAGGPGPLTAGHQVLCDAAAGHLRGSRQVEIIGDTVSLAGWAARVSNPDQALCDQILAAFRQHAFTPPDPAQLGLLVKQSPPKVTKLAQLLIDQGKLVRIDPALVLHRDALEQAKQQALSLFRKQSKFTTMEFRDALAVSRKFAVPVLDYLDKVRFTVRNGHDRTPGAEARKLLNA
jgi:selenocysteine-specific elongation factor